MIPMLGGKGVKFNWNLFEMTKRQSCFIFACLDLTGNTRSKSDFFCESGIQFLTFCYKL